MFVYHKHKINFGNAPVVHRVKSRHNFLHKNIKTSLSRAKKGTFEGLAGVALSRG